LANDQHVPQNKISDAERAARAERFRELGSQEWTALLAHALLVREEWDHASAELEESDSAPGPNDGPWNAWHLLNHVGGFIGHAAAHVSAMAAGESLQLTVAEQWQGDAKTFVELRTGAITGWDAFVEAITTATITSATGAEPGGVATYPAWGELNTREVVAMTLTHARSHAQQMREIRGLAADENPGDSAGDLGRRRQTAH